jgi:hypothetical protein
VRGGMVGGESVTAAQIPPHLSVLICPGLLGQQWRGIAVVDVQTRELIGHAFVTGVELGATVDKWTPFLQHSGASLSDRSAQPHRL